MNVTKLNLLLSNLETHIENHAASNPKVSKSNVGWHLDHSLKVINSVSRVLHDSDPKSYKNNFSFLGKLFFTLGFFPRGKAKAPAQVKPPEVILKEDISSQLELAKSNIKTLHTLDKYAYFKHPLFGDINKARIPRFLELHTNHHLKIINDVLK